ncbi:MAG: hypothetical protein M1274_07680 [Actinobacteria bacterium]|nr:hypothetical protein [Actinomycetota bacterium]
MMNAYRRKHSEALGPLLALVVVSVAMSTFWLVGCTSGDKTGGSTTSSSETQGAQSGDVTGDVGTSIAVADVRITVKSLEATFQPAQPAQRLSEGTPSAPAAGESFYQAYVRVENLGVAPVRVDPRDFACLVGNAIVAIEPTRSGPLPRSLLKNTSLDLILTFKADAGFVPELIYSPPWYDGTITVSPGQEGSSTTS